MGDALTKSQRFLVNSVADAVAERLGSAERDEVLTAPLAELPPEWDDIVYGQNPAAGASYVYTVATPLTLYSVMARLTCSAVAGDRTLTLEYQDAGDTTFVVAGANVTAGALDSHRWCWQPTATVGSWVVGDTVVAPLPVQPLRTLWRVVVKLGGAFDAGDQLDQVRLAARFYAPREPTRLGPDEPRAKLYAVEPARESS